MRACTCNAARRTGSGCGGAAWMYRYQLVPVHRIFWCQTAHQMLFALSRRDPPVAPPKTGKAEDSQPTAPGNCLRVLEEKSWLSAIDCAGPLCTGERSFVGIGLIRARKLAGAPEKIENQRRERKREKIQSCGAKNTLGSPSATTASSRPSLKYSTCSQQLGADTAQSTNIYSAWRQRRQSLASAIPKNINY